MTLRADRARVLAATLELDVHAVGICHACLCFVSFAIDGGDERDVRGWTFTIAPSLWQEGLALPVRLALERARVAGVPFAEEAIADVEHRGARTTIVRAVVRRLAEDLLAEMNLPKPAEVVPLCRGP